MASWKQQARIEAPVAEVWRLRLAVGRPRLDTSAT